MTTELSMIATEHACEPSAASPTPLVMQDVYLPFPSSVLLEHFADTSMGTPTAQQLLYYETSALRTRRHQPKHAKAQRAGQLPKCNSLDHQIERDERFWIVAALLHAFHPPPGSDRVAALTAVLTSALGDRPPATQYADWAAALGAADELRLYFETSLPSPHGHSDWLAAEPDRIQQHVLMPYRRQRAAAIIEAADGTPPLEGATKVDAVLVASGTGFAVIFEAKVMSDASEQTTFNGLRNQIARNIDVMLDTQSGLAWPLNKRSPDTTCFVLMTPKVFKDNPRSRLYGRLMADYADAGLLHADLPHRTLDELRNVPQRLGWTTWEECERLLPGSCSWLNR